MNSNITISKKGGYATLRCKPSLKLILSWLCHFALQAFVKINIIVVMPLCLASLHKNYYRGYATLPCEPS